ncbi:hypothetical protein [Vibrio methylphosphonaticus]|uniref:hypothetical protein n=1 Tax=Vibrio methylphosphonaticus TaxID=2946866 RepID=UPI00202A25B3|nr:hypothetical protein [Vibrio methylphosphonaticus]MCL9777280.1 hypothetical protein [Vibrio methylphosphonaticus]
MKRKLLTSAMGVLVLSGCGTSNKLTVFDGMTYSATNEGAINDPIRVYPLQTTQVSLDGQLPYTIGELCYASRLRSPLSANCLSERSSIMKNSEFVIKYKHYAAEPSEPNKGINLNKQIFELNTALKQATNTLLDCANTTECSSKMAAQQRVVDEKQEAVTSIVDSPNVRILNWNEQSSAKIGTGEESNSAKKETSEAGFTVINGFSVYELSYTCLDPSVAKLTDKMKHLKVVTKLIAADEISFVNARTKVRQLTASLDAFEDSLDTETKGKLLTELLKLKLSIEDSASLSSSGRFKITDSGYNVVNLNLESKIKAANNNIKNETELLNTKKSVVDKNLKHQSPYLAVLTDLNDLTAHVPECRNSNSKNKT